MDVLSDLLASEYETIDAKDIPAESSPVDAPSREDTPISTKHESRQHSPSPSPSPLSTSPPPRAASTENNPFAIPSPYSAAAAKSIYYSLSAFSKDELDAFPALVHAPPKDVTGGVECADMALLNYVAENFGKTYPKDADDIMVDIAFKTGPEDTHRCCKCKCWPRVRMQTHCLKVVCGRCRYSGIVEANKCCACEKINNLPSNGAASIEPLYVYMQVSQDTWESSRIVCGLCKSGAVPIGDKSLHIQTQCQAADEKTRWYAWRQRVLETMEKNSAKADMTASGVVVKQPQRGNKESGASAVNKGDKNGEESGYDSLKSMEADIAKTCALIRSMHECLRTMETASGVGKRQLGHRAKLVQENMKKRAQENKIPPSVLESTGIAFSSTTMERVEEWIKVETERISKVREKYAKLQGELAEEAKRIVARTGTKKRTRGDDEEEECDAEYLDNGEDCDYDEGGSTKRRSKQAKKKKVSAKATSSSSSIGRKTNDGPTSDLNSETKTLLGMTCA